MTEGQQILVRAAKYLVDHWRKTPIRQADINEKLAADKLIWLVHNFDFEELEQWGYACDLPEAVVIKAL